MGDRFGTNSAIYDLSRIMTFAVGIPAENTFNAPIILDNPSITSGIALFSHTPQPFSVNVPAGQELTLIDLDLSNGGAATSQFYGIKIQTDAEEVDTGAGLAIFNVGHADALYINAAGRDLNVSDNNPTGIGIDVNKQITSSAERASANSSQQGIQIFDWSTTNQGIGGPRGMIIQKLGSLNTDHVLMTLRSNRNQLQCIVKAGDAGYDATKPCITFNDETSGAAWWEIIASGEQVFNKDGIGIQWITPGAKTAYILASTNDLKLKSGGTGVRFVNQADTQTIVMMQDDLSVDIPNNETRFQALKIVSDRIENTVTNALAAVSMNYNGYNGGTTQFRDFKVFDGKTNVVAIFTGTYKNVLIGIATDKATTQPHVFLNDGVTMMQQGSGSTGYNMLMWNAWSDNGTFKRRIATNPATALYVGPGAGAGAVEIYFQNDAGNTVDSTISFSKTYTFGATTLGFLGSGSATKQISGANLTNNVASGGTNDTIDNWTDLTTYATDAAAIRNAVYQLARKLKQVNDGLRAYGMLT